VLLGAHCRSDYEPASHRAHRRGVGGTPRRGEPRTKSAPEGDWMTSFLNDISRLDERAAHLIAGHMDGSSGSDVQDSQFGCRKRRFRTDAVAVLMNCAPASVEAKRVAGPHSWDSSPPSTPSGRTCTDASSEWLPAHPEDAPRIRQQKGRNAMNLHRQAHGADGSITGDPSESHDLSVGFELKSIDNKMATRCFSQLGYGVNIWPSAVHPQRGYHGELRITSLHSQHREVPCVNMLFLAIVHVSGLLCPAPYTGSTTMGWAL